MLIIALVRPTVVDADKNEPMSKAAILKLDTSTQPHPAVTTTDWLGYCGRGLEVMDQLILKKRKKILLEAFHGSSFLVPT